MTIEHMPTKTCTYNYRGKEVTIKFDKKTGKWRWGFTHQSNIIAAGLSVSEALARVEANRDIDVLLGEE